MPLDHYVSQVYLKNFYSPELESRMYAIRKRDLKRFTPDAKSVCRIEDGSTNPYLQESRAIEEFLRGIEPNYNKALQKLAANDIDEECRYVIAGFIAYVRSCSPAGMRIHSGPLKGPVEEIARINDSKGLNPKSPAESGSKNITDSLQSREVHAEIDPKFPQAMGIEQIHDHTTMFQRFKWDIMINSFADSPFFTSDFPIAVERKSKSPIASQIVPLSPELAIRMSPEPLLAGHHIGFSSVNFRHAVRKLNRKEVMSINRLIVRCAECVVFFRDNHEWIPKFVERNAKFRIEPITEKVPIRNGTFFQFALEVRET